MKTERWKGTDGPSPGARPGRGGRTGPRTAAGKARSSRNATRHGLSARRDTPEALARHTEVALGIIADLVAGRGRAPMPHDAILDRLAALGRVGNYALSAAVAFADFDEQVQRSRHAKRDAILAAEGVIAFDGLLKESYADVVAGVDRHAREGLDRNAVIGLKAERALEELASVSRFVRSQLGGRVKRDRPFGGPAPRGLVERFGTRSAAVLYALREIARLERYEARALSGRRKALRKLLSLERILSLPTEGPEDEDEYEGQDDDDVIVKTSHRHQESAT